MVKYFVSPEGGFYKLICRIAGFRPIGSEVPLDPARSSDAEDPASATEEVAAGDRGVARYALLERFVGDLHEMVSAERDLLFCGGGADPAVDRWLRDAEASRARALTTAGDVEAAFSSPTPADAVFVDLAWCALEVLQSDDPVRVAELRDALHGVRLAEMRATVGCHALGLLAEEILDLVRACIDLDGPEPDGSGWDASDDIDPTAA